MTLADELASVAEEVAAAKLTEGWVLKLVQNQIYYVFVNYITSVQMTLSKAPKISISIIFTL